MSEGARARRFLFLGNHPCVDFVNTEMVVKGQVIDAIAGFSDLTDWLHAAGLLRPAEATAAVQQWGRHRAGEETVQRARALRATLRNIITALAHRQPVPPDGLAEINVALGLYRGQTVIEASQGRLHRRFHLDLRAPQSLLGILGEQAADLLCTADFALVRQCENPKCILFFLDTSKRHARRWCTMALCGNRVKVAAHYARQRHQT
jgi:predicted RNA-binding Zn ribbon-like protein